MLAFCILLASSLTVLASLLLVVFLRFYARESRRRDHLLEHALATVDALITRTTGRP